MQVGPLDPQGPRRVADSAPVLLQDRRDVFLLEPRPRLFQRAAAGQQTGAAIEFHVTEDVLERDAASSLHASDDRLEQPPELGRISSPRQRR